MTNKQIIKKLRALAIPKERIAVDAGVSYSWLTKFLLDKMPNPRQSSLDKLTAYLKEPKCQN